eukprot:jgi/Tetstr1/460270/TSEL_005570.t1
MAAAVVRVTAAARPVIRPAAVGMRSGRTAIQVAPQRLGVQVRTLRCVQPRAADEKSAASSDSSDDDMLPIERQLAKKRPQRKVKVVAPAVEEARGERPVSPASEFETNVLSVLSFLGIMVLFFGVVLAASGFLPEEMDTMITNNLYPAYSPFVGVFLLCSTAYGVWKSRQ